MAEDNQKIVLSTNTEKLLEAVTTAQKGKERPLEGEQYKVSHASSFFGFAYEKIRNAVEFNEEHLIRRSAIARILKRRLLLNPDGLHEGENLARELMWGRYVEEGVITQKDVDLYQKIIDSYINLFEDIKKTHKVSNIENLSETIFDLMSSEIEENIDPTVTYHKKSKLYYFFQVLKNKITIFNEDATDQEDTLMEDEGMTDAGTMTDGGTLTNGADSTNVNQQTTHNGEHEKSENTEKSINVEMPENAEKSINTEMPENAEKSIKSAKSQKLKQLTDQYFYIASEQALDKNDAPLIMYHLFELRYGQLHSLGLKKKYEIAKYFHVYIQESNALMHNKYQDRLKKFAERQVPPFRILYDIIDRNKDKAEDILTDAAALKRTVHELCEEKYSQTSEKLKNAAIRSISYIFLTKMIFVLVVEIPLSHLLFNEFELLPVAINTIFPPLLMGLIVTFINPPSDKNTDRIYQHVVDIINKDQSFETKPANIAKRSRTERPLLFILFSLLYVITFSVVLGIMYIMLDIIGFNFVSKGIFVFFISVVSFFAYRIRQTAKEYVMETKSNIFVSFISFLFMPLLYLGKIFSESVSKINIFILFFDYLLDAPFKFIIDIVEEWTRFLKERKDELV